MSDTIATEFVDFVKLGVEKIREHLPPDGDWKPVVLTHSLNGDAVFGIPRGVDRDTAFALIDAIIQGEKAYAAAHVFTAWFAEYDLADEEGRKKAQADAAKYGIGNIRSRPNRKEAVIAMIISPTEDLMLMADVKRRTDGPPLLGEWIKHQGGDGVQVEGDIPRVMRAALRGKATE